MTIMQWQCKAKPLPGYLSHLLSKLHTGHHIIWKCQDFCKKNTQKKHLKDKAKSKYASFFQDFCTFKFKIRASGSSLSRNFVFIRGEPGAGCSDTKPLERSSTAWAASWNERGATRQSQISRQRILLRDYFALMSMSATESSRFTYSDLTLNTSASMSVTSHIMTLLKLLK